MLLYKWYKESEIRKVGRKAGLSKAADKDGIYLNKSRVFFRVKNKQKAFKLQSEKDWMWEGEREREG